MVTRVYKYGFVPIGYPPREAINELWRTAHLLQHHSFEYSWPASYDQSIALVQSVSARLSRAAHP